MLLNGDKTSELFAQYQHRLTCLEAALKDEARLGRLSARVAKKRFKSLLAAQAQLSRLQQEHQTHSAAIRTKAEPDIELGLPRLEAASLAEITICAKYLAGRLKDLTRTQLQVYKVYKWLKRTSNGRSHPLFTTLRLSSLRRFIAKADSDAYALQQESQAQAKHVDKLLKLIKPEDHAALGLDGEVLGRDSLEALTRVFVHLDNTITRVAKLRLVVKKEGIETKRMRDWLLAQENIISTANLNAPPPSPLATARATEKIQTITKSMDPQYYQSRKRRSLAEKFWEEVIARSNAERCATIKGEQSDHAKSRLGP